MGSSGGLEISGVGEESRDLVISLGSRFQGRRAQRFSDIFRLGRITVNHGRVRILSKNSAATIDRKGCEVRYVRPFPEGISIFT